MATERACELFWVIHILSCSFHDSHQFVGSFHDGPATEQANKSGGTLATTQGIHDSAKKSHSVVKDEHHRCRALLLASYAVVRSVSNRKQG